MWKSTSGTETCEILQYIMINNICSKRCVCWETFPKGMKKSLPARIILRKTLKAFSSAFLCRRTLPATTAAISFVYPLKTFPTFSATHRQGDLSHPQVPLAGLALPPGLLSSFRYQPTNLRTRRLHAQCPLIMRMIIIARRCFHRRDCTHVDWLDKLFFAFVFLFCC